MTRRGQVARADLTLFVTCLIDSVRPDLIDRVVSLLRRTGATPTVPRGATCCGQPAYNAGFTREATRVARRTVRALAASAGPVVVPSGSCATMLRKHVPELLAETRDADAAADVARRVHELSAFLAERQSEDVPDGTAGAIAYHDSCHMLRELGISDAPRQLLADAGHTVTEMAGADRCCGFGGTFSVKLPAVSTAMADEKLDDAVATGAAVLASCDLSCVLHLDGRARRRGLPLRVCHLAEVLP